MPLSNQSPTQIAESLLSAMTAVQAAALELALSQAPVVEPTDPVVLDPTEESNP